MIKQCLFSHFVFHTQIRVSSKFSRSKSPVRSAAESPVKCSQCKSSARSCPGCCWVGSVTKVFQYDWWMGWLEIPSVVLVASPQVLHCPNLPKITAGQDFCKWPIVADSPQSFLNFVMYGNHSQAFSGDGRMGPR